MATVLIVDDNKEQQTALRDALRARGHTVETAMAGRLAIERGLRLRPDILLTEWLLRDGPGGFRITEALRAIRPETHALVLTRYPSPDVRHTAIESDFVGYLTQPVDMAKLEAAIERALASPPRPVSETVALIEYDATSRIVFANTTALEILQLPPDLGPDPRLSRLLGNRNLKQLEAQRSEWVAFATLAAPPLELEMLSMYAEGGRSRALILRGGESSRKNTPVVRALVEGGSLVLRSQAQKRLPPRALVVDPDHLQRRLLLNQLSQLGVPCHSTDSYEQALSALERDPLIELVLMEYGAGPEPVTQTVLRLQDLRPEVKVIGMSIALRKREFEQLGAVAFLNKPTTQERLKEIIAEAQGLELAAPVTAMAPPPAAASTSGPALKPAGPAVPGKASPAGAGDPLVGKRRVLSKELLEMPLGATPILPRVKKGPLREKDK